ncbi:cysteine--tRNA ligase [Candidatus Lucifugimonas marina]|uniref:Cysteine--tRNA ligase n=1 Tax=Candidatus Lucifugimonas marina TaxID=3038979 RepID=A0AAJ6CT12_9CHLR|nr:cysteine--tRNA ligase [SAR202 cluster bacterium JH702]MDG0870389.1 cysteine--tRNA ligase [SAR202 cluster bacterium JH639]WFG36852.1 cysteine--tRNA ligase [SAR202 cluster bacterium JH545]WFG40791.1 cysteine--tRNA ligase [SAR202 cluster bacterium JH1073]
MQLYNSLTRTKEEFKPLGDEVKMYVCGVTVYDDSHLGHALSSIVFDVLDRYLEFSGYKVKKVQNFTDVDDKIINRANADETPWQVITEKYIESFFQSADGLNVRRATVHPRATEDMPEIIELIERLIDKKAAYELNGSVYYRVRSKSDYGKLSGQNIDEMLEGTRNEEGGKEDPADFALWKAVKPDEPNWDSPWGPGRPGWHIECSAMAFKHLGEQIDIHGGGLDLIFPHHENEIAQSESASGKAPFSGVWMHNGLLRTTGATMSKSLGNAFNVNAALEVFSSDAIRLWILQSHYRTNPLLDKKLIGDAERSMRRIRQAVEAEPVKSDKSLDPEPFKRRFTEAMDDDLNTPQALAAIFDLCRKMNRTRSDGNDVSAAAALVRELTGVLGMTLEAPPQKSEGLSDSEVEALIQQRKDARAEKRWADADAVRDQLDAAGILISDTGGETAWTRS